MKCIPGKFCNRFVPIKFLIAFFFISFNPFFFSFKDLQFARSIKGSGKSGLLSLDATSATCLRGTSHVWFLYLAIHSPLLVRARAQTVEGRGYIRLARASETYKNISLKLSEAYDSLRKLRPWFIATSDSFRITSLKVLECFGSSQKPSVTTSKEFDI